MMHVCVSMHAYSGRKEGIARCGGGTGVEERGKGWGRLDQVFPLPIYTFSLP